MDGGRAWLCRTSHSRPLWFNSQRSQLVITRLNRQQTNECCPSAQLLKNSATRSAFVLVAALLFLAFASVFLVICSCPASLMSLNDTEPLDALLKKAVWRTAWQRVLHSRRPPIRSLLLLLILQPGAWSRRETRMSLISPLLLINAALKAQTADAVLSRGVWLKKMGWLCLIKHNWVHIKEHHS